MLHEQGNTGPGSSEYSPSFSAITQKPWLPEPPSCAPAEWHSLDARRAQQQLPSVPRKAGAVLSPTMAGWRLNSHAGKPGCPPKPLIHAWRRGEKDTVRDLPAEAPATGIAEALAHQRWEATLVSPGTKFPGERSSGWLTPTG